MRTVLGTLASLAVLGSCSALSEPGHLARIDVGQLDLDALSLSAKHMCVRGVVVMGTRGEHWLVDNAETNQTPSATLKVAFTAGKNPSIATGDHVVVCGLLDVDRDCLTSSRGEGPVEFCTPVRVPVDLSQVSWIGRDE